MISDQENLEYAAKIYNIEQIKPHAKACKEKGCPSYIHCFFGKPQQDNNGPRTPMIVCAQRILSMMENQ